MPYTNVEQVPGYVPASKARQWLTVWNDAFAKAILAGESKEDAEKQAFVAANKVAKERSFMNSKNERRVTTAFTSLRADLRADKRTLSGYAAIFNSRTKIGGMFHELLLRGCFGDALKTSDARFFWNHDDSAIPLGRQSAQTLRLAEDSRGLAFNLDLPDSQSARDLWAAVRRGDVTDMSFAFGVADGDDDWDSDFVCDDDDCCARGAKKQLPLRVINRVSILGEISACNVGAYSAPKVQANMEDLSGEHDPLDESDDGTGDENAADMIAYASAGVIVPMEVRSHARALRRLKPNRSDADRLAILKAYEEQRDKDNQRRLNEVTRAILLSDTVRDLDLSSVTAKEIALQKDIADLRQASQWLRNPRSFPGTCEQWLRWQMEFFKSH